jgi:hypothetical protein
MPGQLRSTVDHLEGKAIDSGHPRYVWDDIEGDPEITFRHKLVGGGVLVDSEGPKPGSSTVKVWDDRQTLVIDRIIEPRKGLKFVNKEQLMGRSKYTHGTRLNNPDLP